MNGSAASAFALSLLLTGAGLALVPQPAAAQVQARLNFNYFHDHLGHYGRWMHHPVWGDVWRPRPALVGSAFQPYANGHWELTDEYGWYWVSDDPFDDVVYHYGRWVYDPARQWLWVPGYTWAPAWVVWREGDDYTGWAPLPPDEAFVTGAGLSFGVNLGPVAINFYDRWYGGRVDPTLFFVFVDNRHLVDRDYRRFAVPRERVKIVFGRTREATKFEIANGRVVNRGVDVRVVERATGRPIARVSAKAIIKPNAVITTVTEAKQIRERERVAHPIDESAVRRGERGGNAEGAEGGNKPEAGAPGGDGKEGAKDNERPKGESTANGPDNKGEAAGRARERGNNESTTTSPSENAGAGNEGSGGKTRERGNDNSPAAGGPAGSSESNGPAAGETPKRTRNRNNEGASPGGMNGPSPAENAGAGGASPEPGANPPRQRKPSPSGSMNGPAAGSGATPAENNGANAPPPARKRAQPAEPGSSDAEQKDKRKKTEPPPSTPQQ